MDVTVDTFEPDVIERSAETPVVVDFWAEWCGPCHALGPVLEQEVQAQHGAVVLAKVDIDANPELAQRFGVSGIPAVKAFRDGKVVSEFVGARGPALVRTFLEELLAPPRAETLLAELRDRDELPDVMAAIDAGDLAGALELILEAVPGADVAARDRLREVAVALFELLGVDEPGPAGYRRRLASALY